jgi:hypothetical protein
VQGVGNLETARSSLETAKGMWAAQWPQGQWEGKRGMYSVPVMSVAGTDVITWMDQWHRDNSFPLKATRQRASRAQPFWGPSTYMGAFLLLFLSAYIKLCSSAHPAALDFHSSIARGKVPGNNHSAPENRPLRHYESYK